jgi:hypothetical protein
MNKPDVRLVDNKHKKSKTTVCNNVIDILIRSKGESIIVALVGILISSGGSLITLQHIYAATSPISVIAQTPFTGSDGKLKIVGVVKNDGTIPVEVILGLHALTKSNTTSSITLQEPTYGRIIYPATVSPFKFSIEPIWSVLGAPFIVNTGYLNTLLQTSKVELF